jgi:ABC-2 type transport system permease protein
MDPFWQHFTSLFPAKWFMIITRALFLKDASITQLALPFLALAVIALILVFIAVKRFKVDLEP